MLVNSTSLLFTNVYENCSSFVVGMSPGIDSQMVDSASISTAETSGGVIGIFIMSIHFYNATKEPCFYLTSVVNRLS